MTFEKINTKFVLFPSACFVVFAFLLKYSGISLAMIINLHNDMFRKALISTAGMGTYQSLSFLLASYGYIFLALMFFLLGLSFISSYGAMNDGKENALVPAVIGSLFAFFFLGISLMTAFLCAAMIISSLSVFTQSDIYFNETKKWKLFRTGSMSISSSLMIFNVILAAGALVAVVAQQDFYKNVFLDDMKSTLKEIVLKETGGNANATAAAEAQINSFVDNSPLIDAYIRWLPLLVAIEVWIFLELIRIIASNLGGAFVYVLLKYS